MKQIEKDELLRQLNEEQMMLQYKMALSDAHAAKCVKLGVSFKDEYPNDYATYTAAREKYNANEAEIARVNAIEVEEEERLEEE